MRTLNDYFITAEIEDISTASSTFVAIPDGGKVIKIITALQAAISGDDAAISFEIGGTAMTNGGITVEYDGSAAGDATTARTLGGVQTWIETNVDAGSGGSGAGNGAARTDGTQRAFTEDQLKGVLRSCYNEGGNPNMIMVGAFNKQKLSGFTGGSTRFDAAEDRRLITSIDVYESDFGTMQVAPNRFIRGANGTAAKVGQDALILEMDYWAVSFLRDFSLQTPAQTRDADQRFMVAEYTLESRNEKASGMVTDLTTS